MYEDITIEEIMSPLKRTHKKLPGIDKINFESTTYSPYIR